MLKASESFIFNSTGTYQVYANMLNPFVKTSHDQRHELLNIIQIWPIVSFHEAHPTTISIATGQLTICSFSLLQPTCQVSIFLRSKNRSFCTTISMDMLQPENTRCRSRIPDVAEQRQTTVPSITRPYRIIIVIIVIIWYQARWDGYWHAGCFNKESPCHVIYQTLPGMVTSWVAALPCSLWTRPCYWQVYCVAIILVLKYSTDVPKFWAPLPDLPGYPSHPKPQWSLQGSGESGGSQKVVGAWMSRHSSSETSTVAPFIYCRIY